MRSRVGSLALLLVAVLMLAIWDAPRETPSPAIEGACTSFCLDNSGHAVFGTNYDNEIWEGLVFVNKRGVTKNGWEASTTGRYAQWTAEYGSVTFNLAGSQMAWAGMNEAGLTLSTMWLRKTHNPAPDERPPLISALWLQYQLDTCATVEEVMANNARVRIADTVDHYLVCDRTGACAAVEFLEGGTVFHTGEDMPAKALTNHAYAEVVAAWQTGRRDDNSVRRFAVAADGLTGFRPGDGDAAVTYAFEILERASGQETQGTPTQWSIVFDTENLRALWRTSRNPQIRSVALAKLDFDCHTPVEMQDVHAPLAGDVTDQLGRYSFEANLQHTLNFLAKWEGIDLSAFEVEVLERGLASFPCESQEIPYQAETDRVLSPLVGWVALAVLHRFWPVAAVAGLALVGLVVWRTRFRIRRRAGRRP